MGKYSDILTSDEQEAIEELKFEVQQKIREVGEIDKDAVTLESKSEEVKDQEANEVLVDVIERMQQTVDGLDRSPDHVLAPSIMSSDMEGNDWLFMYGEGGIEATMYYGNDLTSDREQSPPPMYEVLLSPGELQVSWGKGLEKQANFAHETL